MYGTAKDINDCEYRSARLARTEINMAYRRAEQERWNQFDFVVGKRIKTSSIHKDRMPDGDICDTLAGDYPKDFVWSGWHPNCTCYEIPIMKTEEEFWNDGLEDDNTVTEQDILDITKVYGEVDDKYVSTITKTLSSLESEYGGSLSELTIAEKSNKKFAGAATGGKISINMEACAHNVVDKQVKLPMALSGTNLDEVCRIVSTHEYGHILTQNDVARKFTTPISFSDFKKNLDRSLSVDEKKVYYERYLANHEKAKTELIEKYGQDYIDKQIKFHKQLDEVHEEYLKAAKNNRELRISMYAYNGTDVKGINIRNEFVAESFAYVKAFGKTDNPFANRVVTIIDDFYGVSERKALSRLSKESVNAVKDVPQAFNTWINVNKERAKGWSTMPYFVRDNPQYIEGFEVNTYNKYEKKFTRALSTRSAMQESLSKYFQSIYPDIPNTEKAAIYHYTRGDISAYRRLNKQLRDDNLSEFNEAMSNLISRGISKLPTTNRLTYRSMKVNKTTLINFMHLAKDGGVDVLKGFTSCSFDETIAMKLWDKNSKLKSNETNILFVIKGKNGHPIEELSQFSGRYEGKPNQKEVLFDKGLKVRFVDFKADDGVLKFYIEEI